MTDQSAPETILTHAWNYFELHANQRISVFNFFVAFSGLVLAGLAASIQDSDRFGPLGIILGLLLALVSFVFWKLDQRVSFLIKHADSALSEIERTLPDQRVRLFLTEPGKTGLAIASGHWWFRQWTYGKSFRAVFVIMAVIGLGSSVLLGLRIAEVLCW